MSEQEQLKQTLQTLEQLAYRKKFRRFEFFKPYEKQKQFFALGAKYRERMFMAGNQVGKSEGGAYESSVHLTGLYPDWWNGKTFNHPIRMWMAGVSSLAVRDIQQKKLCGPPGVMADFGTGLIPKDCFEDKPSLARGVTDAFDTVQVKHHTLQVKKGTYIKVPIADGISTGSFKSFEQGREKFQGDTIDAGWADEEAKMDVYEEFLARLKGDGILFTTFTPLLGKTELVIRFYENPSQDCGMVQMTLEEALHFTAEEKAKRLAGYRKHQRDARAMGIPLLGSGRVFSCDEDMIKEPAMAVIPEHWVKLWGIDFGIGHPFGAVLILWDRDTDCIHVHHAIRMVDDEKLSLPIHHVAAMKPIGANVPVAWPQDGTARDKGSGEAISKLYKSHGLKMLPDHATWPDGGLSTEAGITEMDERMMTNRFKVSAHLSDWFEEFRNYHRKDGMIVKERDDLMSATRVAVMMKRFARNVQLGGQLSLRRRQIIADDVDFDLFAG